MGGLFGKPNTMNIDVVSNVVNESILKLASTTQSNVNVVQYISAEDNSTVSGNTQYADVKSNTTSIINATQDSGFSTALSNNVGQEIEKKTQALLGAFDGLTQNQNFDLKTKIESNITNLNLVEITPVCATNNSINQSIVAKRGSTITGNSQTVKADFVQSCSSMIDSNMSAMAEVSNELNQKGKYVAENPLDFIADIFKGGQTMIAVIIIAIVAGFVVMIGPGKLDANKLISQGIDLAKNATPQGRALSVVQSITPSTVTRQPIQQPPSQTLNQPLITTI